MTLAELSREIRSGIDSAIAARTAHGQALAERFPELATCASYREFLLRADRMGLALDFVTSSEMWEALQARKG